jgi:glycosyltransferase involved in cell wall biosynthesis
VVTFHLLPQAQRWSKDYLLPLRSERVIQLFDRHHSAHRLVTVSHADKQRLVLRLPQAQVRVIQNVPPLPPLNAKPSAPLCYPGTALRLLSVGRLEAQKGFERLVQALGDPRFQDLDWHWNIVGEGTERGRLEELVRSLGLASRITLVGARPAHDLFTQADLVLCPSRFEGMPLVPLEAQLAGVPVVVSDIAAHRELFGKVPDCFLPGDETAWAGRLYELLASREAVRNLGNLLQAERPEDPRQRFLRQYLSSYDDALELPLDA